MEKEIINRRLGEALHRFALGGHTMLTDEKEMHLKSLHISLFTIQKGFLIADWLRLDKYI